MVSVKLVHIRSVSVLSVSNVRPILQGFNLSFPTLWFTRSDAYSFPLHPAVTLCTCWSHLNLHLILFHTHTNSLNSHHSDQSQGSDQIIPKERKWEFGNIAPMKGKATCIKVLLDQFYVLKGKLMTNTASTTLGKAPGEWKVNLKMKYKSNWKHKNILVVKIK